MQSTVRKNENLTISYVQLRKFIGILGIALPFACILGGWIFGHAAVQTTLSGYYYTNMRDMFIGIMVCVSLFLITYKGYEPKDQVITTVTGIAGFGVAIFPCNMGEFGDVRVGIFQLMSKYSNWVHASSAILFFLLLAINSICIFTISNDVQNMTQGKLTRNLVYRLCGGIIICSLICLIVLVIFLPSSVIGNSLIILFLETVMLIAFGISWLVKGETILKDR